MKLIDLYRLQHEEAPAAKKARALLKQSHWFAFNAEFDPKTGEALPQVLSSFLAKLSRKDKVSIEHDRLWHITNHARPSVERLLRSLNESPRREHALMPVHYVRELDANSFIKLSNRPGRNIREKLAGKPYMQAVRRYQSGNMPENRLLKVFVIRLAELLELRRDYLHEEEDELVARIHSWLRSDEAQAIAIWDNLPPNNTLLSHRDYRRIWDAWRWMQSLDEDIAHDLANFESRAETMREWQDRAEVYLSGMQLFADQPVLFGYNSFTIRPWSAPIQLKETARKVVRSKGITEMHEPVCVDLVNPRPRYATASQVYGALPEIYLWQQWNDGRETFDLGLYHSDAAILHAEATAIASSDLFFVGEQTNDLMQRAARSFASRLRETFKNDSLIWLVPDSVNDFEIEILRRNLNSRFARAEPLPRSVAAVFEQVDYSGIKREGYTVVVVDSIEGRNCATKLIAKFDLELQKRLPETKGIYWERCPPVTLSNSDQRAEPKRFPLLTLDSKGNWHDLAPTKNYQAISSKSLKEDKRIGSFELLIDLKKSPVAGGARLHSLQLQAGDIPLWRDQIPELSIKVMKDGRYQRFCLVARGTTVKPIRGKPIPIQVVEKFKLPVGKKDYKLPLIVGDNAEELGFSARLDSPSFPLKVDTACKLSLTFEYGADEPYKLIFTPLDNSFSPIRATWKRTEEGIITDAPSPEYPKPLSWKDLHCFPDTKNGGTIDLLKKTNETVANLNRWLARGDEKSWDNIRKSIKRWCRFLFIAIWRDGRSISDYDCPKAFSKSIWDLNLLLDRASDQDASLGFDVGLLKAYMHKDTNTDCVDWLYEQLKGGIIRNNQAVGFALGDVSEAWQKDIFGLIASKPNAASVSIFAYAIWRVQHFVQEFSVTDIYSLLKVLSKSLADVRPLKLKGNQRKDEWTIRNWVRNTAEPLELLLGLLRTRSSMKLEIKMLLQPHQKITKQLAEQVERVTEIVAQSNVGLFSRVQINVKKPEGDRTPDLLYALRLYLTGDDGANAIHITSISDSEDD